MNDKNRRKVVKSFTFWKIVILCGFLGMTILLVYFFTYPSYRKLSSFNWKETEGEIVFIDVDAYKSKKNSTSHIRKTRYNIEVEYEFIVDEKTFHGDTVSFMGNSGLNNCPVCSDSTKHGDSIKVYYSPNNPKNSVLDKEYNPTHYIFAFISIILGLLSIRIATLTKEKEAEYRRVNSAFK